jgi:hypothetical protein
MIISIFGNPKKRINYYMLIPLVLGLVGIGYGIIQIATAIATKSWVPVSAQIVKSGKEWRKTGNRDGSSNSMVSESSIEVPVIHYTYEIQSRKYESQRIFVGDNHFSEVKNEKADVWVAKYPRGTLLTAYVNPVNPSESVLLTGVHGRPWITLMIVGFAFVALPLLLLHR